MPSGSALWNRRLSDRCPAARALLLTLTALSGGSAGCAADSLGGQCGSDDDCAGGEVCLVDFKGVEGSEEPRIETYCSQACTTDRDCPVFRVCREGELASGAPTERYCVDRVRICGNQDPRNGLDDDCDGVIDEADGGFITRCLDDAPCGAFVCQAPVGQPETVCAPPNPDATRDDFSSCERDEQCRNGLCDAGICSPMCRPRPGATTTPTCVGLTIEGRSRVTSCARSVGPDDRPEHNLCQIDCGESGGCPGGTACVWRDVVGALDGRHFFVCSELDPDRLPLGASCPSNQPEDDRLCQYGLCFGNRCTRRCGGPGSDCSDVAPGLVCRETVLFYGAFEFQTFVCREPS